MCTLQRCMTCRIQQAQARAPSMVGAHHERQEHQVYQCIGRVPQWAVVVFSETCSVCWHQGFCTTTTTPGTMRQGRRCGPFCLQWQKGLGCRCLKCIAFAAAIGEHSSERCCVRSQKSWVLADRASSAISTTGCQTASKIGWMPPHLGRAIPLKVPSR